MAIRCASCGPTRGARPDAVHTPYNNGNVLKAHPIPSCRRDPSARLVQKNLRRLLHPRPLCFGVLVQMTVDCIREVSAGQNYDTVPGFKEFSVASPDLRIRVRLFVPGRIP